MRDVSDTLELAELTESGLGARELATVGAGSSASEESGESIEFSAASESGPREFAAPPPREPEAFGGTVTNFVGSAGGMSLAVRREGPLKTTLHAQRLDLVGA